MDKGTQCDFNIYCKFKRNIYNENQNDSNDKIIETCSLGCCIYRRKRQKHRYEYRNYKRAMMINKSCWSNIKNLVPDTVGTKIYFE